MRPDVHRLAAQLEEAIEAGDVVRVMFLIDAARLRRSERHDVCRLLSGRTADVVIAFDRFDQGRILTAA